MFDYFAVPRSDPDPILENTGITGSNPSAQHSQVYQDIANQGQGVQFPVPALAMSFLQPENSGSQHCDPAVPNSSSNEHTQHQGDDNQGYHGTSESIPNNVLTNSRGFAHITENSYRPQVSLPQVGATPLPLPLRLPPPQAQHFANPNQTNSSWPPHQVSMNTLVPPLSTQYSSSRQVPVGNLLYNASHAPSPQESLPHSQGSIALSMKSSEPHDAERKTVLGKRRADFSSKLPRRSPRRTRAKRSYVWNFFQESETDPNVAYCKLCKNSIPRGRKLARNTTNLIKHLEHRHREENSEHRRKNGHASVQRSSDTSHAHQQQSQRQQLNINLSTPSPEIIASTNASAFPIGQHPSLANISPSFSSPLSAAMCSNVLMPSGASDVRRSQEESFSGLAFGAERMSSSCNLNFNQTTAKSIRYRVPSPSAEKLEYLNPSGVERGNVGNRVEKPSVLPTAVIQRDSDDGKAFLEPARSTGQTDFEQSSNLSSVMLSLLARMDLPLAASRSKGFEALFSASRIQHQMPHVPKLDQDVLLNRKRVMRLKMRDLLAQTEKLVIVVQKDGAFQNMFCRYLKNDHIYGQLCLEVLPLGNAFIDGIEKTGASALEPLLQPHQNAGADFNDLARRTLDSVEQATEWWGIRKKVIAVLVHEDILPSDTGPYAIDKRTQRPAQARSRREDFDCTRTFRSESMPTEMHRVRDVVANGSVNNGWDLQEKIPVLPSFASLTEIIVSQTICESDIVRTLFIDPMSQGLYKVLREKSFLDSENVQSLPADLKLPLGKISMQELRVLLRYFLSNFDIIQDTLKRKGDGEDITVARIQKEDLMSLENLLMSFVKPLDEIQTKRPGDVFRCERLSIVLPAMKNFLQYTDELYQRVTEPLRKVVADVYQSLKFQRDAMESQSMYVCATLLDPRFKREGFSSFEVADLAESQIVDMLEREGKRKQCGRGRFRDSPGNLHSIIEGPSMGYEQLMDSGATDREVLSSSLAAYLEELVIDNANDVEAYWRRQQHKWPLLAEIAAQYALVPSTCDIDIRDSVLGDYKRLDSSNQHGPSDSLTLSFFKNNLLLVDGDLALN